MAGTSKSGRKSKPTNLKVLQGNAGKRSLNKNEPKADQLKKIPTPPQWLTGYARDAWEHHAPWLYSSKILTHSDLTVFESYCDAYGTWRKACEELNKYGLVIEGANGGPMKNPAATVKNEAFRQMTVAGSSLGLDPSSRTRLATPNGEDEANPFAELLGGKK